MGMHLGFIAVECSVEELQRAFSRLCKHYELIATSKNLGDAYEMDKWMHQHENANTNVFFIFADGPYAILMDFRHVVTCDEKLLSRLSSKIGSVLSFVIETAGGCAYFYKFKDGELKRYIGYEEGTLKKKGRALKQEKNIDITASYYMAETEKLWNAFDLSPYERMARPPIVGLCFKDIRITA